MSRYPMQSPPKKPFPLLNFSNASSKSFSPANSCSTASAFASSVCALAILGLKRVVVAGMVIDCVRWICGASDVVMAFSERRTGVIAGTMVELSNAI
ncbi:hypothetical protein Cni_G27151 [Canna indica]|uniref:Uncharacterized protein n=1 Tax=Canna indica TaxID=4628 RepID=A0AAQ3L0B2_9LILI|nr:hypothetical protein Cni_G27151 [Canna indica]